jgi:hypothetical protein
MRLRLKSFRMWIQAHRILTTKVVFGNKKSRTFVLGLNLDFGSGLLDPGSSSFSDTVIVHNRAGIGVLGHADKVEWTDATTLINGVKYPDGLIYVNGDDNISKLWQVKPDGSNPIRVARTSLDVESTGVFDVLGFVGYTPARILLNNKLSVAETFDSPSSMTLLLNAILLASDGMCIADG